MLGDQNLLCCLLLFSSMQSLRSLGRMCLQTDEPSSGILLVDCWDFCLVTTRDSELCSHLARWIPGETMLPHQTLRLLNPLWIWLPHQQESQWGLAPKRAVHSLRCHYAWLNNWRLSLYQASAGWTQGDEGDTSGFLEGQGLDYSPFWRNL